MERNECNKLNTISSNNVKKFLKENNINDNTTFFVGIIGTIYSTDYMRAIFSINENNFVIIPCNNYDSTPIIGEKIETPLSKIKYINISKDKFKSIKLLIYFIDNTEMPIEIGCVFLGNKIYKKNILNFVSLFPNSGKKIICELNSEINKIIIIILFTIIFTFICYLLNAK